MRAILHAIIIVGTSVTFSILPKIHSVAAQVQVAAQQGRRERSVGGGSLFIPNRELTQQLKAARRLLKEKNYSDGLDLLQHILDKPQDFLFYADPEKRTKIRSHKMEAMRLLAELPQEGKDAYELKFGTIARKKLTQAIGKGDLKEVEAIARSYFHTDAGIEATYLLGTHHFDLGNPLAAALHFQWLKRYPAVARRWEPMLTLKMAVCFGRAGMPEESVKALLDLKHRNRSGKIVLGGTPYKLFEDDSHALEWLKQTLGNVKGFTSIGEEKWTMFRGNPSRNASSSRSSPVYDSLWRSPSILLPKDIYDEILSEDEKSWQERMSRSLSTLQEIEKKSKDENRLIFPAAHPLIVGNRVVFRTLRSVTAVAKDTGETMWEVIPSGSDLFDNNSRQPSSRRNSSIISGISSTNTLKSYLAKRAWQDVTQGTLSTDGKYVYFIDETNYSIGNQRRNVRMTVNTGDRYRTNKLKSAYLKTGNYGAEIGGEVGDNALLLSGSFFLGPPLPLAGKLFVLAEIAGEINLVVLQIDDSNRKEPKFNLLWKQPLIHPRHSVNMLDLRKMAGSSPTYGEGVMICPTTAGSVVAIDLARRVILWGYRYPTNYDNANATRAGFSRYFTLKTDFDRERRWVDSAPTIAHGTVLLTPRDSNDLHCLNLLDGSIKWKKSRGDSIYLAGVVDKKVILVGKSYVDALNIETGESVWKNRIEIPQPSGRGYRNGRFYHLPLSTNEIATIDLLDGRLIAKSIVRGKVRLGNMVSAGGMIVSQTENTVMGFKPMETLLIEIAEALDKNPDDPEALSLRGEIKLHEGNVEGGMQDLRHAVEQKKMPRASRLIVSNLLEGLRLDFSKNRKDIPEIRRLLEDPAQRSHFLKIHAAGLQEVKEYESAFSQYIELAGPNSGKLQRERIDASLSVRNDLWARRHIGEIYRATKDRQRSKLDREIRNLLKRSLEKEGADHLRHFIGTFDDLPVSDLARLELTKRLSSTENVTERIAALNRLQRSSKLEFASFATAKLAQLYLEIGEGHLAEEQIEKIQLRFADVVCFDGKTGSQLSELWNNHPVLVAYRDRSIPWPDGQFVVDTDPNTQSKIRNSQIYTIKKRSPRSSFYRDWIFRYDSYDGSIVAIDADGHEKWKLKIKRSQFLPVSYSMNQVFSTGHFLVFSFATHFFVVDPYGNMKSPKSIWDRSLIERPSGRNTNFSFRRIGVAGARRIQVITADGKPLGKVCLVTPRSVIYQRGTKLTSADILTGEVLWERQNVSRNSKIFGDEKHLLVSEIGSDRAKVLETFDGTMKMNDLGRLANDVSLPSKEQTILDYVGTKILVSQVKGNRTTISLFDPLAHRIIWKKEFTAQVRTALVEENEIAVVELSGTLHILRKATGRTVISAPVEEGKKLNSIFVFRTDRRYIMMTHHTSPNKNFINQFSYSNYNDYKVNGDVYAFDRNQGQRLWKVRVDDQLYSPFQPKNIPAIVFKKRYYQNFLRRRGSRTQKFAIEILDERDGNKLFRGEFPTSNAMISTKYEPADRRLVVSTYRNQVRLVMSDKPFHPRNSPKTVKKSSPGNLQKKTPRK